MEKIIEPINMSKAIEYHERGQFLIVCDEKGKFLQISREHLEWHEPEADSSIMRALLLGQGCWDELDTISKEDAVEIISSWGDEA